jgi:hypothetical protein
MHPRHAEPWRPRLARWFAKAWPFLLSGVAITLFMSWGLPLLLAARGIGPANAPLGMWRPAADGSRGGDGTDDAVSGAGPTLEVRRSAFSDWYIALPREGDRGQARGDDRGQAREEDRGQAREDAPGSARTRWPEGPLEDSNGRARRAPVSVVRTPPTEQRASWGRIDTGLAGWPFRAFASEAWYRAPRAGSAPAGALSSTPTGEFAGGYEGMPEFHWNAHIGMVHGMHILVPLRPLAVGILLDVLFWATVSWCAIAGPIEFRRRRRARYGRCPGCGYAVGGHEVRRPAHCPECGAAFTPDPLGFAHAPEMHFQNAYVWIIFVSSLDIMLTWKILDRGGIEVNPLAALVIDEWGMQGAVAFKFALMMWVIVVCEILARLRRSAGCFLAVTAIVVSASPVAWSLVLLTLHEFFPAMLE